MKDHHDHLDRLDRLDHHDHHDLICWYQKKVIITTLV